MFKLMDVYHPSVLLTKFWRMRKGYMSLRMHHLVMYQITQMLRNSMSHPVRTWVKCNDRLSLQYKLQAWKF